MASLVPSSSAGAASAPAAFAGAETVTLAALAVSVNLAPELAADLWDHMELDPLDDAEVAANIRKTCSTRPSHILSRAVSCPLASRAASR